MFASNNFSFFASVENCYFGKAFRARISEIRGKEKSRSERVDRVVKADARIEGIIQRNLENGKLQNNGYAFWQKCDFALYRFQAKYCGGEGAQNNVVTALCSLEQFIPPDILSILLLINVLF